MPQCRHCVLAIIAASVLIAIAGVLISPAVPSAPTLLPVSALVLVGIIVLAARVIVGTRHVLLVLNHPALMFPVPESLLFAAGLPLRR